MANKIKYLCDYCDNKFVVETWSYYYDESQEVCPKCKSKMTIKNVVKDGLDLYGYNDKPKEVKKIDTYKK